MSCISTTVTDPLTFTYLQEKLPELVIGGNAAASRIATGEEGTHILHVLTQFGTDLLKDYLHIALGKLESYQLIYCSTKQ